MEYAITSIDFGQGPGWTMLPVARCKSKQIPMNNRPYSAFDVITKCYGEDFQTVLRNYISMEQEEIRKAGVLIDAQTIRLVSYRYVGTRSMLQQPISQTTVDFIVSACLEGTTNCGDKKQEILDFRVRYILDMRPCEKKCIGPIIVVDGRWDEDPVFSQYMFPTNEYLLPILFREDYEKVAHQLIEQYYPEMSNCIGNPGDFIIDGEDLARRMGLTVCTVSFVDQTIMGQIYYDYGEVKLKNRHGQEYSETIYPGTILVSAENCSTQAIRNSTIIHECCHMYLDRWFFLLQMMTGQPFAAYTSRKRSGKAGSSKMSAVDWMERQCDKLPAYLIMPREDALSFVTVELEKMSGEKSPLHTRSLIEKMMKMYNVSFAMAKYRLIELGYYEAEGIKCYVNNRYMPDHGCGKMWPPKVTFTISASDFVDMLADYPDLEEKLTLGQYLYVEGHFCINQEKYITLTKSGSVYMTTYGRTHVDECCMGFRVADRFKKVEFTPGIALRKKTIAVTDKYKARYEIVSEPGTDSYKAEVNDMVEDTKRWMEVGKELPSTVNDSIRIIMKRKGITQETLAELLGVDRRMVYKLLNTEKWSKEHIVGVIIALKIPYYIASQLLNKASIGLQFNYNLKDCLYMQFLVQVDSMTLEKCHDVLKAYHLPPLFNGGQNFAQ